MIKTVQNLDGVIAISPKQFNPDGDRVTVHEGLSKITVFWFCLAGVVRIVVVPESKGSSLVMIMDINHDCTPRDILDLIEQSQERIKTLIGDATARLSGALKACLESFESPVVH